MALPAKHLISPSPKTTTPITVNCNLYFAASAAEQQPPRTIVQIVRNTASCDGKTSVFTISGLRGLILNSAAESWLPVHNNHVVHSIPTSAIDTTKAYTADSAASNNAATPATTIPPLYNPASQDPHCSLQEAGSLTQDLISTSRVVTAATDSTTKFATKRNTTYLGKEPQQPIIQSVEACQFKIRAVGQSGVTGCMTIRKGIGGRTTEQVTAQS